MWDYRYLAEVHDLPPGFDVYPPETKAKAMTDIFSVAARRLTDTAKRKEKETGMPWEIISHSIMRTQ